MTLQPSVVVTIDKQQSIEDHYVAWFGNIHLILNVDKTTVILDLDWRCKSEARCRSGLFILRKLRFITVYSSILEDLFKLSSVVVGASVLGT